VNRPRSPKGQLKGQWTATRTTVGDHSGANPLFPGYCRPVRQSRLCVGADDTYVSRIARRLWQSLSNFNRRPLKSRQNSRTESPSFAGQGTTFWTRLFGPEWCNWLVGSRNSSKSSNLFRNRRKASPETTSLSPGSSRLVTWVIVSERNWRELPSRSNRSHTSCGTSFSWR
jgi:hypothetical protein